MSLAAAIGFVVFAVSSVVPPMTGEPAAPVARHDAMPLAAIIPPPVAKPSAPIQPVLPDVSSTGFCRIGSVVMVPDGREGVVTSQDGETCRVLAYGERYVSLWNPDMIEPVYPQLLPRMKFGH